MAFVGCSVVATRKAANAEGWRNPARVRSAQSHSRNVSPQDKHHGQGPLWTFNKIVIVTTLGNKGSPGHPDPDAQISEDQPGNLHFYPVLHDRWVLESLRSNGLEKIKALVIISNGDFNFRHLL